MTSEQTKTFNTEGCPPDRLRDLFFTRQSLQKKNVENLKATTAFVLDAGERLLNLKETLDQGEYLAKINLMGLPKTTAEDYIKVFKTFGAYREAVQLFQN